MTKTTKLILTVILAVLLIFTEFCALFSYVATNSITKQNIKRYISGDTFIYDRIGDSVGGTVLEGDGDVIEYDNNVDFGALQLQLEADKKGIVLDKEHPVQDQYIIRLLRSKTATDIFADSVYSNIYAALNKGDFLRINSDKFKNKKNDIAKEIYLLDEKIMTNETQEKVVRGLYDYPDYLIKRVNEILKEMYESISPLSQILNFMYSNVAIWTAISILLAVIIVIINSHRIHNTLLCIGSSLIFAAVILKIAQSHFLKTFKGSETLTDGLANCLNPILTQSLYISVGVGAVITIIGAILLFLRKSAKKKYLESQKREK